MTKIPLPSPRSPAELDKKILAYAQQRLPEKKHYRPPLWLSGLATASVVVVAVLIAMPNQAPSIMPGEEPPAVSTSMAKTKTSAADQNSFLERSAASADMKLMASPAARKKSYDAAAGAMYEEQEIAVTETTSSLDSDGIKEQLQPLAAMLKNGDSEKAMQDYREIIKLCPDCDLPPTLEEAIEKYLATD